MVDNDFLLVGLGNPGPKYENTRHNVGFIVVDELVRRWGESFAAPKGEGVSCRVSQWGARIYFVKPMSFMNLSGRPVAELVKFYKISISNIIVIHDDLDMHPGRLKLIKGGGAGGHNGIRSVSQYLGTSDFFRLKIGIGRPGKEGVHPDFPVDQYVLSAMTNAELELLGERTNIIEDGLRLFFNDGPARAMSLVNSMK